MIKRHIEAMIRDAFGRVLTESDRSIEGHPVIELAKPRIESHGDLSCNVAMMYAKQAEMKPRDLAEAIVAHFKDEQQLVAKAEIAGPGFINLTINPTAYWSVLAEIERQGEHFGESDTGGGRRVQVEFVSANPTGPLHIGHGRGAVYGDALASVLAAAGFQVTREYYVNDTGNQIQTLGRSVWLRLQELEGKSVAFPQECYQGDYIIDVARDLKERDGWQLAEMDEAEAITFCGEVAGTRILAEIKEDLAATGVVHDTYFHEENLHTDTAVERTILWLRELGFIFELDGALWFRTTDFGDDKDRVLRKSDGLLTYFAADIAYHKNKYDRGFERIIDIWGADHGGYVARMKAAVQAMGHAPESFDAVLIQLVNLKRGGESVSMSTRAATYETLADVREQVGRDVCRYFFLMRSHNAQLDFDLELAKRQTPDNPVFYIQYAHARICSIFRKAAQRGLRAADVRAVDTAHLDMPEEAALARMLGTYPEVIAECAEALEPHKLAFYLLELARQFQSYYSRGRDDDRYRVVSGDVARSEAKLYLLKNVQRVLQNALRILGISAPEEMAREDGEQ